MKYVVLARDKNSGTIVESFGVYKNYNNAVNRMAEERYFENEHFKNEHFEYCIEEVNPLGSYANEMCED